MTAQQYNQWTKIIRESRFGVSILRGIVRGITAVTFFSYGVLLFWLMFSHQWNSLYQSVLVPGVSFVAVSVFRRCNSAKRPYEELNIQPLLNKETRGRSFPSRHVFSSVMIAMTFFEVNTGIAVVLLVLSAVLAVSRVLGGVHYIRDVAAGAAIGVLCGLIGYHVIF